MSDNTSTPSSSGNTETLTEVTGIVKWFDPRKGFGFIIGPDGQDIFVHFTVIEGDGFRVLKDGASVVYDAEHNDKGWRSTRVHREATEARADGDEQSPEVVVPRRTYSRTPRR
jgi:CspA family cold shock protein